MVAHACNANILEAEAGELLKGQGQPELQRNRKQTVTTITKEYPRAWSFYHSVLL